MMKPAAPRVAGFSIVLTGLLFLCFSAPEARATTGHLRLDTPIPGHLELGHAEGWSLVFQIPAGATTLWDLPTGAYAPAFVAAARRPGEGEAGTVQTPLALQIWDGLTTALRFDPAANRLVASAGDQDGRGALTTVEPALWRALPGTKDEILAGLDTHPRWRPETRVGGITATAAPARAEILAGERDGLGPGWIALSPADGATRNLTLAHPMLAGRPGTFGAGRHFNVAAGAQQTSHDGTRVTAHLGLLDRGLWGAPARGTLSVAYAKLDDAAPRATAARVLPHNDLLAVDLTGRLDLGAPGARVQSARGNAAGRWDLSLTIASRGWQRNHYLEAYRYNLAHAPYEETALFEGRADASLRLGATSRGGVYLGYSRYLTWLGDGRYRQDLGAYGRFPEEGNGCGGLYWSGETTDDCFSLHAFDYFMRTLRSSLNGGLSWQQVRRDGTRIGLYAEAAGHTLRHFEHYAPTDTWAANPQMAYGQVLRVGYNAFGTHKSNEEPFGPGQTITLRAGLSGQRDLGRRTRIDLGLGIHWFNCRDSALVSLADPYGSDQVLDAGDLERPDPHLGVEGSLGLRRRLGGEASIWAYGYRSLRLPPLVALTPPRAHLAVIPPAGERREGVIGNPALAPEAETGLEVGLARPLNLLGRALQLRAALHAARIDEAVGMAYIDPEKSGNGGVPTYVNSATLRRYGLHLEATSGAQAGPFWVRAAYDLARVESDQMEPPLLDGAWIDPDRPRGEYETEGYGGPLGGILDAAGSGGRPAPADFRPANMDRTHQLSVAVVSRPAAPPAHAGWLRSLTGGWTKGLLARFESGRPVTQVYIYGAGLTAEPRAADRGSSDPAWARPLAEGQRNDLRLPARFTLDAALSRWVQAGQVRMRFSIEALNLLVRENPVAVYRATGSVDDDGYLILPGANLTDPDAYRLRLENPNLYGRAFTLRVGIGVELL